MEEDERLKGGTLCCSALFVFGFRVLSCKDEEEEVRAGGAEARACGMLGISEKAS